MKILFPLSAYYPSQIGGPCNTLYWHTTELKKHNVSTRVITTSLGINLDSNLDFDKLLDTNSGEIFYTSNPKISFKIIITTIKSIKEADILHLNSLFSLISIITFFYASFFYPKKPIVWSVRGELNSNALKFSAKKKFFLLFLYKKLCKNVYFHSTSSQETIDITIVFPKASVFMIPNYILTSERINGIVKDELLYVGRIHPIKALHKLINSLIFSQEFMNSNFKLLIVGKQEERYNFYLEELKELVKKLKLDLKVEFVGHKEGVEKEKLYASSYFTILPSETENFGNVVLESLNQGTPVIASLGTPWAILEDYKCGLHVSNSIEELAFALNEILSKSKEEYLNMRKNATCLIDDNYNIEKQIIKWVKKYEEILNSN